MFRKFPIPKVTDIGKKRDRLTPAAAAITQYEKRRIVSEISAFAHGHRNAPSCARLRFCIRGRRCADLGLRGSVLMQCGPQGRCRPHRRASRYPCCLSPANSSVSSNPLLRAPAAWLWSGRGLSIATGCIFVWGVAQQNETPNSLPGKVDHLHFFTQRLMTIVIGRGAPIDQ